MQLYIYMCLFFFKLFSCFGHYITLSRIPCALQSFFVVVQSLSHVPLCNPMNCNTPDSSVLYCLPELVQIHDHWLGNIIKTSHLPHPPFSSCLQFFSASGSFPMSHLFALGRNAKASIFGFQPTLWSNSHIHTWLLEKV